MNKTTKSLVLALGVGAVLMGSTFAAKADDDGGWRMGVGPVRAWVAPPPVVVVHPPVRYAYRPYGWYGEGYRDARRDWRRHEWREHRREGWHPRYYGYGGRD